MSSEEASPQGVASLGWRGLPAKGDARAEAGGFPPRLWIHYAGASLLAIVLPLLLVPLDLPFVSGSYSLGYRPYELFGLTASVVILGFLGHAAWQCRALEWRPALVALLPALLPALVGLHYLQIITEFSGRSGDWNVYQGAAQQILAGSHPYGAGYLYPPLPAQALAGVERLLAYLAPPLLGWSKGASWWLLEYVYQCTQLLLLQLSVYLCYRLARRWGLPVFVAGAVVAALYLINNPMVRTLRHLQINLWVLDFVLLALVAAERRPRLAGICLALATHIKIHPVVLLGPWLITRRWRAVASTLVALAAVVAVQLATGSGVLLWSSFFEFADSFPLGREFRDNSLHSLAYNLVRFPASWVGLGESGAATLTGLLSLLASGGALLWLGLRALRREGLIGAQPDADATASSLSWRLSGHSMDALAVPLLCAPLVWEHHYVMALPIAVWAVAFAGRRSPWWIAAACLLIFGVPTFDVFPLSYHRLAGLVMLLYVTSPSANESGWSEGDGS